MLVTCIIVVCYFLVLQLHTSLATPHDLTCQVCEKQCTDEDRFFKHIHKYHPEYWRVFSGGRPLTDFIGHREPRRRDKPYMCTVCHKRYSHETGYLKHMASHPETEASMKLSMWSCPVCQKVFTKESYLLRHMEMKLDEEHAKELIPLKKKLKIGTEKPIDVRACMSKVSHMYMRGDSGEGPSSAALGLAPGQLPPLPPPQQSPQEFARSVSVTSQDNPYRRDQLCSPTQDLQYLPKPESNADRQFGTEPIPPPPPPSHSRSQDMHYTRDRIPSSTTSNGSHPKPSYEPNRLRSPMGNQPYPAVSVGPGLRLSQEGPYNPEAQQHRSGSTSQEMPPTRLADNPTPGMEVDSQFSPNPRDGLRSPGSTSSSSNTIGSPPHSTSPPHNQTTNPASSATSQAAVGMDMSLSGRPMSRCSNVPHGYSHQPRLTAEESPSHYSNPRPTAEPTNVTKDLSPDPRHNTGPRGTPRLPDGHFQLRRSNSDSSFTMKDAPFGLHSLQNNTEGLDFSRAALSFPRPQQEGGGSGYPPVSGYLPPASPSPGQAGLRPPLHGVLSPSYLHTSLHSPPFSSAAMGSHGPYLDMSDRDMASALHHLARTASNISNFR